MYNRAQALKHTQSLTYVQTQSLKHTLTHVHTHTHIYTCTPSHTLTHAHTHALTHNYTHITLLRLSIACHRQSVFHVMFLVKAPFFDFLDPSFRLGGIASTRDSATYISSKSPVGHPLSGTLPLVVYLPCLFQTSTFLSDNQVS